MNISTFLLLEWQPAGIILNMIMVMIIYGCFLFTFPDLSSEHIMHATCHALCSQEWSFLKLQGPAPLYIFPSFPSVCEQ